MSLIILAAIAVFLVGLHFVQRRLDQPKTISGYVHHRTSPRKSASGADGGGDGCDGGGGCGGGGDG